MAAPAVARSAFRLVSKIRCNGLVDVTKYASERTGLKVTIADVKGPVVKGYFYLATEADSDDGLPHTLEHLVFMGSEKYPYKGFLDLIANRCLASGTNAWTDTDHTCYTLSTAGPHGFLIMLPIYLDHIFRPLLTEAQYITEVHHINGQGEDGGVVYCEMQEHESDMSSMVEWIFKQRMFPEPCGYRYETGGRLANLRTSTSHKKVKDFHAAYYHPRNCNVFISGQINHNSVFEALSNVEDDFVNEKRFDRPWTNPVPPLSILSGNVDEVTITCPSDDGNSGMVLIGWRGPLIKNYYEFQAMDILSKYLSDTAVSPLQRDFVQVAEPYCASVDATLQEYSESCATITFRAVPKEKLSLIRPKLSAVLKNLIDGTEQLDMRRMDDLLRQTILQTENNMELCPHSTIAHLAIADFLYSDSEENTTLRFDDVAVYKRLRLETKEFWLGVLKRYLSPDQRHVCIIGEPSKHFIDTITEEEKKRVKEQKEQLGEEGLAKCEERVNAAIEENEKNEADDDLIKRCIVDGLEGIEFFKVHATTNRTLEEDGNGNFSLSTLPFTALLGDCSGTNFINLCVQLDTSDLDKDLKPLLFLWHSLLFESPILRNGELIRYEDVVKLLNRDLVSYNAGYGVAGYFLRLMSVEITVDAERYENAVEWMRQLLYDVEFTPERIRVIAQRSINLAAEYKRDGHTVASFLISHLNYEPRSQATLNSIIRQEEYLKTLLVDLDKDPSKVVDKLREVRDHITSPSRLISSIFCDTERLKQFHSHTEDVLKDRLLSGRIKNVNDSSRAKIFGGSEPLYLRLAEEFDQGIIASVGSCESCYLIQISPCKLSRSHPDYAALKVLIEYLSQTEGPLWREIRGRGLAYGAGVSYNIDAGLLQADLYRTSDPVEAYQSLRRLVVDEHLSDDAEFDDDEFEAAKRSLVYSVIGKESTIQGAGLQSLLAHYRGIPQDYKYVLLKRIFEVQKDQLVKVGQTYLSDLFDVKKSNIAITCHPSKLNDIVDGFKGLDRNLRIVTLDNEEFRI